MQLLYWQYGMNGQEPSFGKKISNREIVPELQ